MKKKLTELQRHMYNGLLDLSWDNPHIDHVELYMHLSETETCDQWMEQGTSYAETLRALESAKKVLVGLEDVAGVPWHTVTPIVKGGHSYAFPSDVYTSKAVFLAIHQLPKESNNA